MSEARLGIIICPMALLLQLYRGRRESPDIRVEPATWKVWDIPVRRGLLLCFITYFPQYFMIDAPVNKSIAARCTLRDANEFVGRRDAVDALNACSALDSRGGG